jgi:hypothetical protein
MAAVAAALSLFASIDVAAAQAAGTPAAASVGTWGTAASPAGAASFGAAASGGSWGTAEEVPGTARLNSGADAEVYSVSCASAGNCSAGGYYTGRSFVSQAFVVNEVRGHWGTVEAVPGTARLNSGGSAQVSSVSCASAGNCSAGGLYTDRSNREQAFVVSEVGGHWGTAEEVPGTARLNAGYYADASSVSCASAGNCSAGGNYTASSGAQQAFVVNEVKGHWGTAEKVPGAAEVLSVSCASPGNCSAGGSSGARAFVVNEVNGHWGGAENLVGIVATEQPLAAVSAVSCASTGNCSGGGYYYVSRTSTKAFVVNEVKGHWGEPEEISGNAEVFSVSCASAGNCGAGASIGGQAFVINEVNGHWAAPEKVPGTARLNTGPNAGVSSVSCSSAGNCSAGGHYLGRLGYEVFVVNEVKGHWGTAEEIPGTARLNTDGYAGLNSLSCARAGYCSAGGYYGAGHGDSANVEAFVVSEK